MVELKMRVDSLFNQELNIVKQDLVPQGYQGQENLRLIRQQVSSVLDMLGEASARAQGLRTPITSGSKMGSAEDQTAYILVEQQHDSTRVIGLLKVGRKRLFLLDESGQPHELQPHCVLDFYVVEDRQRDGCGKKLFEFMLQTEKVEASNLAIDRPSEKLVSFMKKHYGLVNTIPQVNNYVIFSTFFKNHQAAANSQTTTRKPRIYMGKLQYV